MNISNFSRICRYILHYGLFASISHAAMILLYARISEPLPPMIGFSTYFPMIEHSIVSFFCVLFGALLCFYLSKKYPEN